MLRDIPLPWSLEDAKKIGWDVGVDWDTAEFSVEDFHAGLLVELEHGMISPMTNVTDDCCILTGRIALAHLIEHPRYYEALAEMEAFLAEYEGKEP